MVSCVVSYSTRFVAPSCSPSDGSNLDAMKPLATSLVLVASVCLVPEKAFSVVVAFSAAPRYRWVASPKGTISTLFTSESLSTNSKNERNDPSDDTGFGDRIEADQDPDQSPGLKGSRFSRYAPDASLPPELFREKLKENMKANLEERRRNNPNRGNQPAKSYLDSL
jgi:hypothetical protein